MQARTNTGILHMNNGQPPNRSNTCISGYSSSKPNYALSNFAQADNPSKTYQFNDPDVGKVSFPTSEHYLHFQQLSSAGKNEMRAGRWRCVLLCLVTINFQAIKNSSVNK